MRRDDAESIAIWAARPDVWALEPQQVKRQYGAAVEKARKALLTEEVEKAPKNKTASKKKVDSTTKE